ncbi:MAG TPA: ESX secretion-associated protein EspG [Actinokineospora sp.]|jgi:hypothetical protein|nr:ESX secretion-associated protein EspG [Actinokineospora sp.]
MDTRTALHPVEIDLLCTFAEVEVPFPIEIPSAGQTDVERGALFSGAAQQLRDRGLADERGPLDVAEEFVYLLRACTGVIDLVLRKPDSTLAVAVLTAQDEALLVVQDSSEPNGMVRVQAATLDDALGRLDRMVPRVDASPSTSFSLPKRALRNAFDAMLSRMPENGGEPNPLSQNEIEDLLRSHGIDDRVARRMVSYLQPVEGSGQIGAAQRDDTEEQWHRVGDEIQWIDTPRGRFRLAGGTGEDADWMSVNPLGVDELRSAVRGLAAHARR